MNSELAVLGILRDDSAVTDIVATRVYLNQAPQAAILPYIIVEEQDVEPFNTKDGVSVSDHDTVRVYPYATTKRALISLYTACRNALDGVSNGIYNTVAVNHIYFKGQTSFDEQIENRKAYAKDQEYLVRVDLYSVTGDRTDVTADSTLITADNE